MKLTKANLAEHIHDKAGITWGEARHIADLAVRWLAGGLEKADVIELRGLGTFKAVDVPERPSSLPTTKTVSAHRKIRFNPGRVLRKALRQSEKVKD
jgi:integration host factor subunit alpha